MSIFEGRTIKKVRWMTPEEIQKEGWEDSPHQDIAPLIELDDGSKIYASQDGEGNGPGVFFGTTHDGQSVYVAPEPEEKPTTQELLREQLNQARERAGLAPLPEVKTA